MVQRTLFIPLSIPMSTSLRPALAQRACTALVVLGALALMTGCSSTPSAATSTGAIDNSSIGQADFRTHRTTYGVVYRLPADVTGVLDMQVTPVVQQALAKNGLQAEANTFNLPHVTVVHIHSADPATPQRMLQAMPALPPVLQEVHLQKFYTTEAAKGAGKPWWLDLGIVKKGQAYDDMMAFNTRATAALAPLRDGPLPRVTGPVYAKMGDAGKELVRTVGVSGVNVVKNGQTLASHNPHNTLVYSESAFSASTEAAMNDVANQLNRVLPGGITTTFDSVSIVELAFSGNVTREIYRISLQDGSVVDVRNGKPVKR